MKRYIVFGNNVETLTLGVDGLWRDDLQTIWALTDDAASVDSIDRCGVGFFSLPEASDADCSSHDYAYSSPAYQAFHTRKEADEMLRRNLIAAHYPIIGPIFYRFSRWFGKKYWERKDTNN